MGRPRLPFRLPLFAAAALAAASAAACSSGSSSPSGNAGGGMPEQSTVSVYTEDTQDSVPLWIAERDGYFRQQGLNVKITYVAGSASTEAGLLAHTVDFALENYVGALQEESAHPQLGLRFIVDDQQATANTSVLMIAKNSPIRSVADLKGKTVAFPSPGLDVGSLELDEQLHGYGIGPGSYTVEALGFPDMAEPLARGEIAAAFSVQPFITILESSIGAKPLIDFNTGATANFPSTAWATTEYFERRDPKTVAAFQRAMEKATQVAAANPALVRQLMPAYVTGLTQKLAAVIALQAYNTTLSLTRLQRVADAMAEFGALPENFAVKPMILPLPPGA